MNRIAAQWPVRVVAQFFRPIIEIIAIISMLFNGNRIYKLVAEYGKLEYPINIYSGTVDMEAI